MVVLCSWLIQGSVEAGAARTWPDSSAAIVSFADQLPSGMTEAQKRFAAQHLAGTQKQTVSEIRALRAYNTNFLCLHYQLAVGCGPSAFIIGNDWTSDWTAVNRNTNWFLRNAGGSRVHQSSWNWDVMDISPAGNSPVTGFPAYWIQTSLDRIRAAEDDGVFADSYTPDAYTFGQCSPDHAWFNDVDACNLNWIPQLNNFGRAVHAAFESDASGYKFIPNLGGLITGWDTTDYGVGDGGMVEGFAFWNSGNYFDVSDWHLQVDRALALARAGKILICQSYVDAGDYDGRMFVTASYLLLKNLHTYVNMMSADVMALEYYPEYDINLGPATQPPADSLDALFNPSWGVYRRDYANGIVLVNPGDSVVSIASLGGTYRLVTASSGGAVATGGTRPGHLNYANVTSLSMQPHTGAVLLRTGSWTKTFIVSPDLQDVAANCYTSVLSAVSAALPGDTVLVRSGRYREQVTMPAGGVTDAGINLRPYPGEYPLFDGIQPLNQADFVVTDITLNPVNPLQGKTFTAYVTVTNTGTIARNAGYLFVYTNKPVAVAARTARDSYAYAGVLPAGGGKRLTIYNLKAGSDGAKTFRAFIDATALTTEASETNNQTTLEYNVIIKPDVRVTGITLAPAIPSRGGVFDAKVTVKNIGSAPASNVLVSVWICRPATATNRLDTNLDGSAPSSATVGTIATNTSITYTLTGLDAGTGRVARILRAFADSDQNLDEISEINNQLTCVYTPASRPDFIITDITLSTTNPPAGSNYTARVTVKNVGYVSGYAGYMDTWTDKTTNVAPGALLRGNKYAFVGTLNTNAMKILTFTGLPATNAGPRVFRAVVDSRGATIEIVETNNQQTADYVIGP